MLLKGVFDQTAFVNFNTSNNFKQNIDETHFKKFKIHTSLWMLKMSRKKSANHFSRDFCQMFVISKKNLYKIYSIADRFYSL
jgi:hypothetical protein